MLTVDLSDCKEGHQEPELGIPLPSTHYMAMNEWKVTKVHYGTLLPKHSLLCNERVEVDAVLYQVGGNGHEG